MVPCVAAQVAGPPVHNALHSGNGRGMMLMRELRTGTAPRKELHREGGSRRSMTTSLAAAFGAGAKLSDEWGEPNGAC